MDVVNRTFVGMRLPETLAQALHQEALQLRRRPGGDQVRWHSPAELVLHLSALGELSLGTMAAVRDALRPLGASFQPMRLTFESYGGIPNLIQPRYVVANIGGQDAENLVSLARLIEAAVAPVIPSREVKPFQPQVTLGRLKTESEQLRVSLGRTVKGSSLPPLEDWMVDHFELMISTAGPTGVGYACVESVPFRL